MSRWLRSTTLAALVTLPLLAPSAHAGTLKMATLAPERSPWGKVFTAWTKAVSSKTGGSVNMTWLWNGVAGPEHSVVGKIKSGQLAGSAITATGLAKIHKPILALQMPGIFKSWAELDSARNKLAPEFSKALSGEGFFIGGWGDTGVGRVMSTGYAVRLPNDLKGHTPSQSPDDILTPKVFEVIGGVTPKMGGATDVLPQLQSGQVDTLFSSALAAEQLQWAPRLTHINDAKVAFGIGALLISERELGKLTADERSIVEKTAQKAAELLNTKIRQTDDEAYARISQRLTVHHQTAAEAAEWHTVFRQACQRVKASMPGHVLGKIGAC